MHVPLAIVRLGLALCVQTPNVERETWPDGKPKLEREVVTSANGAKLAHGAYRAWHENGVLAAEGRWSNGLRAGDWQTWYANGQLATKGRYLKDHRDGKWWFWGEDGVENQTDSGRYEYEEHLDAAKRVRFSGELRDGQRHGAWTFLWPAGYMQLEAAYRNGVLHGECVFRHSDGSPAWWIHSGVYDGGKRTALLSAERWRALRVGAEKPPRGASAIDAALANPSPPFAQNFAQVLDELARADLASTAAVKAVTELAKKLSSMAGLNSFGWREGVAPADAEYRREVIRSWGTIWELERDDRGFWVFELAPPPDFEQPFEKRQPSELVMFPRIAGLNTREVTPPAAHAGRFAERRDSSKSGASSEQALRDALAWLVAHQSPDGRWDCDAFSEQCAKHGGQPCSGPGVELHDIGVTALAVLALLGDGNTFDRGAHANAVVSGIAWLCDNQSDDGLIGEPIAIQFLYDHAYATMALCEASACSNASSVKRAAQLALAPIYRAQNPLRGWRYSPLSLGDNDTSVTGLMLTTLGVARITGFEVEEQRFGWGCDWLDEMTDPDTGRCGYTERSQVTARLAETVKRFPAEYSEAMTALALTSRYFAGPRAADVPVLAKHASVVVNKLPRWDEFAGTNDLYYWFWGTQALFHSGGDRWKKWNAALQDAVVRSQRRDAAAKGSWNPVDAWGDVGGRGDATALAALTLETPYRYASLAPAAKKR